MVTARRFSQIRGGVEGFECHLLVIGFVLMIVRTGGGRWSVDPLTKRAG